MLLKIARDKGFERLVKLEKGKQSVQITMIKECHKSSSELSLDQTKVLRDQCSKWLVISNKKWSDIYSDFR